MLAEVAGKKTASIHLTEPAKMQKDMIGTASPAVAIRTSF